MKRRRFALPFPRFALFESKVCFFIPFSVPVYVKIKLFVFISFQSSLIYSFAISEYFILQLVIIFNFILRIFLKMFLPIFIPFFIYFLFTKGECGNVLINSPSVLQVQSHALHNDCLASVTIRRFVRPNHHRYILSHSDGFPRRPTDPFHPQRRLQLLPNILYRLTNSAASSPFFPVH